MKDNVCPAVGIDGRVLNRTAKSLAKAFLCGQINNKTAVELQQLLQGVSYASLSLLVGDKLLITQGNLLEPGYMQIQFEPLQQTVAGQAILQNNVVAAKGTELKRPLLELESREPGPYHLVSVPISQRDRRASFEICYLSHATRNKAQQRSLDDLYQPLTAACLQRSRGPPMGSMTIGLSSSSLPMTQISLLGDLADRLAPLLKYHCSTIVTGLETIFQQQDEISGNSTDHSCLATMPSDSSAESDSIDRWNSEECIDEIVDQLMYKQSDSGMACDMSRLEQGSCS